MKIFESSLLQFIYLQWRRFRYKVLGYSVGRYTNATINTANDRGLRVTADIRFHLSTFQRDK